jgi:hypothetical protein
VNIPSRYAFRNPKGAPYGYLIFYRVLNDTVEILHVPHGTRDYEPILSPNERKFQCLWSNRAIEQADDNHWRVYQ